MSERCFSSEGRIAAEVDALMAAHPDKVEQALRRPANQGWFVGQVMAALLGRVATPSMVAEIVDHKMQRVASRQEGEGGALRVQSQ